MAVFEIPQNNPQKDNAIPKNTKSSSFAAMIVSITPKIPTMAEDLSRVSLRYLSAKYPAGKLVINCDTPMIPVINPTNLGSSDFKRYTNAESTD